MRWRSSKRLVLGAVLATPLILMAGFVLAVIVTPLPEPSNPKASEILDVAGKPITKLFTENRVEVPVVDMPSYLLDAVVAVEDDRFYQHRGLDPIGIGRALFRNIRAGKILEGGSTLTQQLARNLYLTLERTWTRKLREAILTVKLEYSYSKQEILGMYWNTIYLGNGAYGVEVASQTYFGKSARDLTLAEAALLAGLPRSPEYYSPVNNPEAAVQRRNLVLTKMAEQKYISAEQAESAKREPFLLSPQRPPANEAPYAVDYIVSELRTRYPEVAEQLYQGGYRIYTSLDMGVQRAAEQAVAASLPQGGQAEAALVAIEPSTGYLRAMVGGRTPTVKVNRALEPQQPGSAFKPFVYAAALETFYYNAASTQLDKPAEFPGATEGQPWRPRNYNDEYSGRPANMREALRKSLNVVTAQWMNTLKPGPVIKLAHRMGIQSPLPANLTIGLGSAAVSPFELTTAYAPFANGGYAVKPFAVLKVTDQNGTVVAQQTPTTDRVLDPGAAFIITDMLKEVIRPGGTAHHVAGYFGGRPVAGKTGTSDEGRDAWFVGYTPDLVTGVWVGDDQNTKSGRTGGSAAAPLWASFMTRALAGRPHRDWSHPANVVSVELCSLTGLRPNASCPATKEWFLKGTEPDEVDPTVHWDQVLPELPGVPWAPRGTLPPGGAAPAPEPEKPAVPLFPRLPALPFPVPSLPTPVPAPIPAPGPAQP